MAGSSLAIPFSPGRPTMAPAATTLSGCTSRSRGRVEGIPWVAREGVGEGNGGDPVLGVEGEGGLSSHRPDAEKLSNRVEHHLLLLRHPRRQG